MRLRSYVPLLGEGLEKATGVCPNEFFAPAEVKSPLLSKKLNSTPKLAVKTVYEYDLKTVPGGEYLVVSQYNTGVESIHETSLDSGLYDLMGRPSDGTGRIEIRKKDGKSRVVVNK